MQTPTDVQMFKIFKTHHSTDSGALLGGLAAKIVAHLWIPIDSVSALPAISLCKLCKWPSFSKRSNGWSDRYGMLILTNTIIKKFPLFDGISDKLLRISHAFFTIFCQKSDGSSIVFLNNLLEVVYLRINLAS